MVKPVELKDNFRISKKELILLLITFVFCAIINISSINKNFGLIILFFECTFSLMSPFSALMVLSASQISADPVGIPFTTVKVLFIAWAIHFSFRMRRFNFNYAIPFLKLISLYYIYFIFATIIKGYEWVFGNPLDLAILVGIMGATFIGQAKGRYRLALLSILLGAVPAIFGYWLLNLGIPFEGIIYEEHAKGAIGIGFGRSDTNNAALNIALATAGLAALCLSPLENKYITWEKYPFIGLLGILVLLLGIPALAGTMSRGGIINFSLSLFITLVFLFVFSLRAKGVLKRSYKKTIVLIILTFILLFLFFAKTDVIERLELAQQYSLTQSKYSFWLSRGDVWTSALGIVLSQPFLGETFETKIYLSQYGYEWASHNVFLDAGRGSGLIGMILYAVFFFYPLWKLIKKGIDYSFPFIITYFSVFITFMTLSVVNHKTFFLLWSLNVIACRNTVLSNKQIVKQKNYTIPAKK